MTDRLLLYLVMMCLRINSDGLDLLTASSAAFHNSFLQVASHTYIGFSTSRTARIGRYSWYILAFENVLITESRLSLNDPARGQIESA